MSSLPGAGAPHFAPERRRPREISRQLGPPLAVVVRHFDFRIVDNPEARLAKAPRKQHIFAQRLVWKSHGPQRGVVVVTAVILSGRVALAAVVFSQP